MKRLTQTAALVAAVLICVASTAIAGPACTPTYPRGLKIHGTNKHPIPLCVNGDLQSTWGACVPRFRA